MQLSKALEGYVISALAEGYSQLTVTTYQSTIQKMIAYLGDKELKSITTDDLRGFMMYLVTDYAPGRLNNPGNKDKLSTVRHHRNWKAMRSFFKWADKDLGIGRPDLAIKIPAWESREIVPFSEEEIKTLLRAFDYASVPAGKRKAYQFRRSTALRDKEIILLLFDTGARVGELTRLRIADANLENGEIYIRPFLVKRRTPEPLTSAK